MSVGPGQCCNRLYQRQNKDFNYPRFYTSRLMLKEPRKEDLDFLATLFSDPEVMHYIEDGALRWERAIKYADAIIRITEFSIHHGWWLVSRREDAARPGLIRLGKYENVPLENAWGDDLQIDYEFAVSAWGHGYATEALNRVLLMPSAGLMVQNFPGSLLGWTGEAHSFPLASGSSQ